MEARKKRSDDGSGRIAELLSELAMLRDQEARILKQLDILQVDHVKPPAPQIKAPAPYFIEPLSALLPEPLDYDGKRAHVEQERSKRVTAIWKTCAQVIKQLKGMKAATWFLVPVNIPGYLDIIKHPMDLSVVKDKLDRGRYSTPLELAADIRLIFVNCATYTPDPAAPVRQAARQVSSSFEKKWQGDQGIEAKWHEELARQQAENEELEELRRASSGTVVEKLKFFDTRVLDRLRALQPPRPAPGSAWTFEQKRKLSVSCTNLQMDALYGLMEVIAANHALDLSSSDEVELDIDALPDAVLHKMQLYVDEVEASANKSRPSRPSAAATAAARSDTDAVAHAAVVAPSQPVATANHVKAEAAERPQTNGEVPAGGAAAATAAAAAPAAEGASPPSPDEPSVTAADKEAGSSSTSGSSSSSDSGTSKSSKGGNSDDDVGSKEKVESTMADADKKWVAPPVDVGDASALVSATQPRGAHPRILQEADAAKTVEVENANAWALLEEVDVVDGDGSAEAEEPAAAPDDPLWNDYAKMSEQQDERARLARLEEEKAAQEREEKEKEKAGEQAEAAADAPKDGEAPAGDADKPAAETAGAEAAAGEPGAGGGGDRGEKRKLDDGDGAADGDKDELEQRALKKRAQDLAAMNSIGNDGVDDDMGFGDC